MSHNKHNPEIDFSKFTSNILDESSTTQIVEHLHHYIFDKKKKNDINDMRELSNLILLPEHVNQKPKLNDNMISQIYKIKFLAEVRKLIESIANFFEREKYDKKGNPIIYDIKPKSDFYITNLNDEVMKKIFDEIESYIVLSYLQNNCPIIYSKLNSGDFIELQKAGKKFPEKLILVQVDNDGKPSILNYSYIFGYGEIPKELPAFKNGIEPGFHHDLFLKSGVESPFRDSYTPICTDLINQLTFNKINEIYKCSFFTYKNQTYLILIDEDTQISEINEQVMYAEFYDPKKINYFSVYKDFLDIKIINNLMVDNNINDIKYVLNVISD